MQPPAQLHAHKTEMVMASTRSYGMTVMVAPRISKQYFEDVSHGTSELNRMITST